MSTRVASARKCWRDVNRQWLAGGTPIDEMPALPICSVVPARLISFVAAKQSKPDPNAFVHFYIDDYRQESVWDLPGRYVELFKRFGGIITPDYSPYLDMNLYQQRFNIYRQRVLGSYYASLGIPVIPNLRMGSVETIPDALRGIGRGSVVAVSTVGAVGDDICTANHIKLLATAVDKLGISDVIVYGRLLPKFSELPVRYHEYSVFYDKFKE